MRKRLHTEKGNILLALKVLHHVLSAYNQLEFSLLKGQ
jgi:hypothetical protein